MKRQLFDATFVGFGLWTVILSAVFIALCETELVTSSDVQRYVKMDILLCPYSLRGQDIILIFLSFCSFSPPTPLTT